MSRSASTLPEAAVAIVGGGIIGLSIAWQLARLRPEGNAWRVAVIEKNLIGEEASWAGAGMLSPGGEVEGPSLLAELAMKSRESYGQYVLDLEQGSGLAIDYQECGALEIAYSADELQFLEERAKRRENIGIQSKPVSVPQIAAFWPRVRSEGRAGGRFFPKDAIVNPREVVVALATACRKLGVSIVQNCAVARIEIARNAARVHTASSSADYAAAVIAAGAWSSEIAVKGVAPIPAAEPVRGHLIGFQQPEQTCSTIVRHGDTYLLQRANGLLIAGSSIEHVGFDREVRPDIATGLRAQAAFVFPHLGETTPTETWVGFRPASDAIHIEAWHSERLYLAYGHYRNGILLAPITAKMIAAAIDANLQTR